MENLAQSEEFPVSDDFIGDYLLYVDRQESPTIFHIWTALSIIASAVGRRVWFNRGFYKLFINQFISLISGSAKCRKTTAIEIGLSILYEAQGILRKQGLAGDQTGILSGKVTPEALFRSLSSKGLNTLEGHEEKEDDKASRPLMLVSGELGMLMSKASIANGLVDILMDLYTCPEFREYQTKTAGGDKVYQAYLNIISATTPSWIAETMTKGVFDQGLVGRHIFVYSNTPHCSNMWPELSQVEKDARKRLVGFVRDKTFLTGEMKITPEAKKVTEEWYNRREEEDIDLRLSSGFFGREHEHLLKVAMTLSIIRSDSLVIEEGDISLAQDYLDKVKSSMPLTFKDLAFDDEIREVRTVENLIRENREMTKTQLVRQTYRKMTVDTLDESLKVLKEAGRIDSETRKSKSGPKAMWYWWVAQGD